MASNQSALTTNEDGFNRRVLGVFLEVLRSGLILKKWNEKRKNFKDCLVQVNPLDNQQLTWGSKTGSVFQLDGLVSAEKSKASQVKTRHLDLCLTLTEPKRILILMASSPAEYQMLYEGFTVLLRVMQGAQSVDNISVVSSTLEGSQIFGSAHRDAFDVDGILRHK